MQERKKRIAASGVYAQRAKRKKTILYIFYKYIILNKLLYK
jgi:hypothetical protein